MSLEVRSRTSIASRCKWSAVLAQTAGAGRIKNRGQQFRLERLRRSAAAPAVAEMPGNWPWISSVCNSGASSGMRAAGAFRIEPPQGAAQQPRGGVGALRIAAQPEKIVRQARGQIVARAPQFDALAAPPWSSVISSTGRLGNDPGVLAGAAVLHGNELAARCPAKRASGRRASTR